MLMFAPFLDMCGVCRARCAGGSGAHPECSSLGQRLRLSKLPQGNVLLQNQHQVLLLAAWKVLRSDVVIHLRLGGSREEVRAG